MNVEYNNLHTHFYFYNDASLTCYINCIFKCAEIAFKIYTG